MKLFDGISSQSCVLVISVICALSQNTVAKKKLGMIKAFLSYYSAIRIDIKSISKNSFIVLISIDKGTKSKGDEPNDLSEAESQSSYGYGYGTKVEVFTCKN